MFKQEDINQLGLGVKVDDDYLRKLDKILEDRITMEVGRTLARRGLLVKYNELLQNESVSDQEIAGWLEANLPERDQIALEELDIMVGDLVEVGGDLDKLVAFSPGPSTPEAPESSAPEARPDNTEVSTTASD